MRSPCRPSGQIRAGPEGPHQHAGTSLQPHLVPVSAVDSAIGRDLSFFFLKFFPLFFGLEVIGFI